MATIFVILALIQTNLATIFYIQQTLFVALSAFFQLIKMPKTSKFFGTWAAFDAGRAIRWIGPILQRVIDMRKVASGGIVALALLSLNGCALLKTADFWDTAKEVCIVALTARDDVKTEAKARNLTVLCNLSDVIEQFVIDDSDPKASGERAMSAAKARGLQR
jgi:hypothetical protein